MRLSAKAILNFSNANSFSFGNQWIVRAGDPNVLYFQLIDLDQAGMRYIPGLVSTPISVSVTFPSLDDAQVINSPAYQDPNDKSIWYVNLGQNQKPNSGNVTFTVAEGSSVRKFGVLNLISVEQPNFDGSC